MLLHFFTRSALWSIAQGFGLLSNLPNCWSQEFNVYCKLWGIISYKTIEIVHGFEQVGHCIHFRKYAPFDPEMIKDLMDLLYFMNLLDFINLEG